MPAPDRYPALLPGLAYPLHDAPQIPRPDYADLERRIADLEERAHRQDKEAAARERLRAMGLIIPNDPPAFSLTR